jgi:hypothetical protein
VSEPKPKHWFWQFMVVLGVVIAVMALVDLKYLLVALALVWIGAAAFSLHRVRRNQPS